MKKSLLFALLFSGVLSFSSFSGVSSFFYRLNTADTTAPLRAVLVNPPVTLPRPVTIRIYNDHPKGSFSNGRLEWTLFVNGELTRKGNSTGLTIPPGKSVLVHLPFPLPPAPGDEAYLQLRYWSGKTATTNKPLPDGKPLTEGKILREEELLLKAPAPPDLSVHPAGPLFYSDDGDSFRVWSGDLQLQFNKQTGWLQQYKINGYPLLADSPVWKSDFWREPTARDSVDNQPAGWEPWREASRDPRLQLFSTSTGSELIIVRAEYTLPSTSSLLHLSYTINAIGEIKVEQSMEGDSTGKGAPLPLFGMRMTLMPALDSITWYGRDLQSPGMRIQHLRALTAVGWWKITDSLGWGIRILADSMGAHISHFHQPEGVVITYNEPTTPLPYGNYHFAYKLTPMKERPPGLPFRQAPPDKGTRPAHQEK